MKMCADMKNQLPGLLVLLALLAGPTPLRAQPVAPLPDSAVFTLAEFSRYVREQHPVARQAALLPARARQEVQQARGAFDPRLESKFYGKELDGKPYFYDWDNALRVPIWLGGIDLRAGFERGVGPYVNPQEYTSPAGLSYLGVSVPLGQGLLLDERRAALRQAQTLVGGAEAERRAARNKLILSATKDYWEWSLAGQRLTLLRRNREYRQRCRQCRGADPAVRPGASNPRHRADARRGQVPVARGSRLRPRRRVPCRIRPVAWRCARFPGAGVPHRFVRQ